MTKELELFKRWFGIDLTEDPYQDLKIDFILPDAYIRLSTTEFSEFQMYGDALRKLMNLPQLSLLSIEAIYNAVGFSFEIFYNIPPEFKFEWEQYVKEMKGE